MFKKFLNKKKEQRITFQCPFDGQLMLITDCPDEIFAQKMLGDGFSVDPHNYEMCSPVSGEVTSLYDTCHLLTIKTDDGYEVIIHIGKDTVELEGKGFTPYVKEGDRVEAGQHIMSIDGENVKDKVPTMVTSVIIANLEGKSLQLLTPTGNLKCGDEVVMEIV